MDNKKTNAPTTTVTRDLMDLCEDTGNIYETVAIIGKRANQISIETKKELTETLERFASSFEDNLEEVTENSTQNSVSIHYEKQPKPTLIATQEYIEGKIYFRRADREKGKKESEE
ncbi:MAG: DNA-directed RNA polymerase subunit omega [Bacteroides sp.]|nr:DNA-directed RNA polymerase subunit omega [Bacteroides sp.]